MGYLAFIADSRSVLGESDMNTVSFGEFVAEDGFNMWNVPLLGGGVRNLDNHSCY